MLLMVKPTGAELTFMLLMLAICVAGKLMPQLVKNREQGIHIFNSSASKK